MNTYDMEWLNEYGTELEEAWEELNEYEDDDR